jgi:hypothetical protein
MLTNTAEFPTAGALRRPYSETPVLNALILVLVVAAMALAVRATNPVADHTPAKRDFAIPPGVATDLGLRTSHGGVYRGEVTAATVRVGESHQWTVRLERRNHRRVAHAGVQVRVWMPETRIESVVHPAATYVGGGNYRLDGVRLTRNGWWNIALIVDGCAGVDSLAFNVRVP